MTASTKREQPTKRLFVEPLPQTQKPTVAVVNRQFFNGKDPVGEAETKNEELKVSCFVTEPAKVSVEMGLTVNLGNYESARIGVSVVVPCYREEIDDAYAFAHRWAETRIGEEVKSLRQHKPNIF
jgi:hypothetical protein